MIFGFNTDIRVGKVVYHVQTEDRGPSNPVIDTTIYVGGRIVHRCANSYKEAAEAGEFGEDVLRKLLEKQHRFLIDGLRDGTVQVNLPAPAAGPAPAAQSPEGIHVQLLNPASWLAAGTVNLKVEVKSSVTFQPVPSVRIKVAMQGITGPVNLSALTDAQGRAEFAFPLPRIGPGGTELVINASGSVGEDEIRYCLRPRARPASTAASP